MKPILVYSRQEAERNAFVVEKFEKMLGCVCVEPSYRGPASLVVNRSNDFEIAKFYQNQGIKVFNGADFTRLANDKQLCYDFMQENDVSIMQTRYSIPPFVKKPRDGHGGMGVVMCDSALDYDENMVCQKCASELGKDLRVWVLNDEIVCSILRTSKTDFRSNYCLGGNADLYEMNDFQIKQVNKIISLVKPMGAVYYGIDFVFDNGKMVFNELEDTVGARMVYDKTNIDIIDRYIEYIKNATK